jgi:hypothetical protein
MTDTQMAKSDLGARAMVLFGCFGFAKGWGWQKMHESILSEQFLCLNQTLDCQQYEFSITFNLSRLCQ